MTGLAYLFAFVLVLSLVVIVHEGGHFLVARACGVKVVEFSLGFGKELFGRVDKHGTRWKVCLIPLGGYVKMLGDADAASARQSDEKIAPEDKDKTFMCKKLWQRALIIFAGPGTNYLFAFCLLTGLFWAVGTFTLAPYVGSVLDNSVAQKIGIQKGDMIQDINGHHIDSFSDIKRILVLTEYGHDLTLTLDRQGKEVVLQTPALQEKESGQVILGITPDAGKIETTQKLTFIQSMGQSGQVLWETTADTLRYLGQVLTGSRSPKDLRGPLGIAEASGDALMGGVVVLLSFIAHISIALGLMNLLPIPVLDGGHLAFYGVEAVLRRPLSEKVQNTFIWTGLGILMLIFAYSLFLDVPRIFQRIAE